MPCFLFISLSARVFVSPVDAPGKYHSYFTVLIHLNSIDDLCGGTEIWSNLMKRGDLVSLSLCIYRTVIRHVHFPDVVDYSHEASYIPSASAVSYDNCCNHYLPTVILMCIVSVVCVWCCVAPAS